MPELFGMPYLFPAIVVVVLLAVLVSALVDRRRKQTAKPPAEMERVERETEAAASDPFERFASPDPPLESSSPYAYGAIETNEVEATSAAMAVTTVGAADEAAVEPEADLTAVEAADEPEADVTAVEAIDEPQVAATTVQAAVQPEVSAAATLAWAWDDDDELTRD